jgi:hypothetical protein
MTPALLSAAVAALFGFIAERVFGGIIFGAVFFFVGGFAGGLFWGKRAVRIAIYILAIILIAFGLFVFIDLLNI